MQARLPSFKGSATRYNNQRYSTPKGRRYAIALQKVSIEPTTLMRYKSLDQKVDTRAFCEGMHDLELRIQDELTTSQRGMHNIENELVFKSNPGFVFHDSRGFEAGGAEELEKVKEFITKRSKRTNLSDQLHVIWYVICRLTFQLTHALLLQVLHSNG